MWQFKSSISLIDITRFNGPQVVNYKVFCTNFTWQSFKAKLDKLVKCNGIFINQVLNFLNLIQKLVNHVNEIKKLFIKFVRFLVQFCLLKVIYKFNFTPLRYICF